MVLGYTKVMLHTLVSTKLNGSMKTKDSRDIERVRAARTAFLAEHNIALNDTTLVHLTYESDNFCRYQAVDKTLKGDGLTRSPSVEVDGLVATEPGHALFLPLADCIGAVLHDPTKNILMLTHLGRHNLEQNGGTTSVEYLVKQHGIDPNDLIVWLSPAAGKENYPLFAFDGRSLHDVATDQLQAAGVVNKNITASPIDTTKDKDYYSHSEFLKGHQKTDDRFAVAVVMN